MDFMMETLGSGFSVLYGIYSLFCSGLGIAAYVLRSLSLYSIARRRGINHPWMSWVPVLDLWVLGCISDQFQYVVKLREKNKRKWLLGLNIVMALFYVVFLVFGGIAVFGAVQGVTDGPFSEQMLTGIVGAVMSMLVCIIPLLAITVAVMVIRYVAMYDLYTSCCPQNNVLFLVLSIFFPVTEPFFLFFVRNKEDGMPPRKQPQYVPPQPDYEYTQGE